MIFLIKEINIINALNHKKALRKTEYKKNMSLTKAHDILISFHDT